MVTSALLFAAFAVNAAKKPAAPPPITTILRELVTRNTQLDSSLRSVMLYSIHDFFTRNPFSIKSLRDTSAF